MHGDKVPVFSFADFIARLLGLFSGNIPDGPPKGKTVPNLHKENAVWTNKPDAPKVPRKEPVRLAPKLWDTAFGSYKALLGYDVANHQGSVDHEKFSEYPFVFLKATEGGKDENGRGYVDPRFEENKEKCLAAGKIWSAYHFARVSLKNSDGERGFAADGRNEAEWLLDHYGREIQPGMLPPVLDIEWDKRADKAGVTPKEVVIFCEAFVQHIKDELGVWPIVYTGPNFWKYKLAKTMTLSQCPLWIVSGYKGVTDEPSKEIPGWEWVIHQHSNNTPRPDGKPPGTSGLMDANFFRGSLADLRAMASIPESALKRDLIVS